MSYGVHNYNQEELNINIDIDCEIETSFNPNPRLVPANKTRVHTIALEVQRNLNKGDYVCTVHLNGDTKEFTVIVE